jgi:hypothetical protein
MQIVQNSRHLLQLRDFELKGGNPIAIGLDHGCPAAMAATTPMCCMCSLDLRASGA